VAALMHLGIVELGSARLEEAERHLEQGLELARLGRRPRRRCRTRHAGTVDVWQGRFEDAEHWLERAEHAARPDVEPATGLLLHVARGRRKVAAAAFRAAAQLEALLVAPQLMTAPARRLLVQTQLRLGDTAAARATLAGLREEERDSDMEHRGGCARPRAGTPGAGLAVSVIDANHLERVRRSPSRARRLP
jgi:LuxR family transcriptional regulator, maltose regulon positive regulatory protein